MDQTPKGALPKCVLGLSSVPHPLDRLWLLSPRAYKELAPYQESVGIPFLLLGATLAAAGSGWFKRRL